jgi:hypothetical protein
MKYAGQIGRLTLGFSIFLIVVVSTSFVSGQEKPVGPKSGKVPESNSTEKLSPKQVIDRVLPSVVLISAQDENGEVVGLGSGFFIQPGLIATNLHVFTRASQATVKLLGDGKSYKVTQVVGIDMRRDLCVVRVDNVSTPPLSLGPPATISLGDDVIVIGNPLGLEGTVSRGIVSGLREEEGLVQIDAAISPGSSGGPVINSKGQVIGVAVSSLVRGQNLNFAVAAEHLALLKFQFKVPVDVAGALSLKDRQKDKLKGSVRCVTTSTADYDYDTRRDKYIEGQSKPESKECYDLSGNLTDRWMYINNLVSHDRFAYNDQGFMTQQVTEGSGGYRKVYELSDEESLNEKIRDRRFSSSVEKLGGVLGATYDRDGNMLELRAKTKDGDTKDTFSYGKNGFVSEQRAYLDGELKFTKRSTYEIDDNGNWTKQFEESFSTTYPSLGFTPSSVTYREISYFGN